MCGTWIMSFVGGWNMCVGMCQVCMCRHRCMYGTWIMRCVQ